MNEKCKKNNNNYYNKNQMPLALFLSHDIFSKCHSLFRDLFSNKTKNYAMLFTSWDLIKPQRPLVLLAEWWPFFFMHSTTPSLIFCRRCQDTLMHWLLLMTFAQQMSIEFVHIVQLFPANITFPWITFTMTTLVQEVERFVGKFNATEQASEYLFPIETSRIVFGSGRCYGAITNRRSGRSGSSTCWSQTALYHIIVFHGGSIASNTIIGLGTNTAFQIFPQQWF